MKNLISIFALGTLVGCAASTPDEARQMGPERQYSFKVDNDYQTTYKRVLDAARNCYQGPVGTAMMLVNGDIYSESKSGTVSVGMYGAVGASIYQVIDLKAIDSASTDVTAIFPMGPIEKQGFRVKAWATGSSSAC